MDVIVDIFMWILKALGYVVLVAIALALLWVFEKFLDAFFSGKL